MGSPVTGTVASSTVAIDSNEYSAAQSLAAALDAGIAPISSVTVPIRNEGARVRFVMSAAGTLRFSTNASAIGASFDNSVVDYSTSAGNVIELLYSPLGFWQPYSNTPWYEYRDISRAIVSESVSGSDRYRSEWGRKSEALFSCSNVKRARLFKSAGLFHTGKGGFNDAAGRKEFDVNGTLEGMIEAANSVDVLTIIGASWPIYCSLIDPAILSDFTAALTETDGKRMYDVSLPLRHIGFG